MTTLALDFTAMMSAAAAQHLDELAAKDARIAALEAEHAAMADQLDRVWSRCERLTNARDSLKTKVAALESLVSERAVAAEQQAFDDLRGSVLAEEAHAAAAAQAQAEAEEAGPVIDLTGEDAPAAAQGGAAAAAEAKPASRAYQGNLIWWAFVAAMRVKYAHQFVGMPMADQVSIIAELKNRKPMAYAAFGEAWKKEHPGEGLVPMDEDQRKKAIAAAAKRSRQRNKANVGGAANA